MRLSEEYRKAISTTVAEIFGEQATVSLFGSRVDDNLRGGDIDLLVQSPVIVPGRQKKTLALVARLQLQLGDQPIDVLLIDPETELHSVHEEALSTGLIL